MVFTENKGKWLVSRFKNPDRVGKARLFGVLTFLALVLSIYSLSISLQVSFGAFILAVLFFIMQVKNVNLFWRYNHKLVITDREITLSFCMRLVDGNESEEQSIQISQLKGIEYYVKTGTIAFIAPVLIGTTWLKAMLTDNVYHPDLLEYLKKNVMEVTYIQNGSFEG